MMNMKRIIFFSIYCIAVFLLTACGEKKITVKGADGTEYESYQECCAAQDFQAAHQYLAKLKNSNSEELQMQWYDAKLYVFKQEALFLMSIGDDSAKKRLLYLLKEESGENEDNPYLDNREKNYINRLLYKLIDIAIENDDESFVKTLANQFRGDVNDEMLTKLIEYLSRRDINENCDYLISLLKKLNETKVLIDYAINSGNMKLVEDVAFKSLNIQDYELLSQLASLKIKKISDDILSLISKYKIKGSRVPPSTYYEDVLDYNRYGDKDYNRNYADYISSINEYNKVCDQILEIAINRGNDYLARNVLLMYKEDVIKLKGGDGVKTPDGKKLEEDYYYCVYYRNDSKNNAQKRYREAKMNGAFKK